MFDFVEATGQTAIAMRVLYVTNRYPGLSTRGDQLRAYQQILHLSARHAITLLAFGSPEGDPRAAALLASFDPPEVIARFFEKVTRLTGLQPNIDAALAALVASLRSAGGSLAARAARSARSAARCCRFISARCCAISCSLAIHTGRGTSVT